MDFAFLFPGQGSQSVGMLDNLSKKYPEIRKVFNKGEELLSQDLWKLVTKGPEEKLNLTVNTQPAIFLTSIAMWNIWDNLTDQAPNFMCGHSLGEYSALVCAGSIKFKDALLLVSKRAELMQSAVPKGEGAMLAIIGLEQRKVMQLCQTVKGDVEVVNFNSYEQVVAAGHKHAIDQLQKKVTEAGAHKAVLLPVSIPAHSSLMRGVAQEFASYLENVPVKKPMIPVLHNIDAAPREDPDDIKDALVKQLYSPVQWLKTIKELSSEGIETFVEVGPSRILCGLSRRIDRTIQAFSLKDSDSLDKALQAVEGFSVGDA